MTALVINSAESLSRALGDIREAWNQHKFLRLKWTTGKSRSLNQNDISHAWYEQVAAELREDDAVGVKCDCKLWFGVPILRTEDDEFRAAYDSALKHQSYEVKREAMKFWPVTSIMSKDQLSRYLEVMQVHYRRQGVRLEFPEVTGPQKARRKAA